MVFNRLFRRKKFKEIENVRDFDTLENLAETSNDDNVRHAAKELIKSIQELSNLNDNDLKKIILSNKPKMLKLAAIDSFLFYNNLEEIINKINDGEIREQVIKRYNYLVGLGKSMAGF